MRQDLHSTFCQLMPLLLAAALSAGCVGLAEDIASHLATQDIKAIDQDLTLIEGDLALFKQCLERRGGSCQGDASTPVPHSAHDVASKKVDPTDPGGSQQIASSVANLPDGDPAKVAHEVLTHPVVQQVAAVHDHLRGHEIDSTKSVSVQKDEDGNVSTVNMNMKLGNVEHFHLRLLSSIGIGAWAALHKHCKSVLEEHKGSSEYHKIQDTCRQVTFIRGYLEAYLRKGEFLGVDVQVAGAIQAIQKAGPEIQGDIESLRDKVLTLQSDVGKAESQATTDLSQDATALTTRLHELTVGIESKLTESLGSTIATELNTLVGQVSSSVDSLVSRAGSGATDAVQQLAQSLDDLLDRISSELQSLENAVGNLDQRLVNDINTEVGNANSKLSDVFRVSNVGFVSRDSTFQARLPTFEIALDPTAKQLVTVTDEDSGQLLTRQSNLTNLGVVTDTSGVGTGASVGAEIARVFLEAVFDAAEGLPAIAPANQGDVQPTGLSLGDYSLPVFQTSQGNIDSQDLAHLTYINDQVAAKVKVLVSRIISGIGPFSLNNPSIESLITEVITTSVRKAVAKGTWCWYACNLDVDTAKLKADVKKAVTDEEAKLKAEYEAKKKKLEAKLDEARTKIEQAIKDGEKKAQKALETEVKKIQSDLEKAKKLLDGGIKKAQHTAKHVKLRLKLGR